MTQKLLQNTQYIMDHFYNIIDVYNPTRKREVVIVFDDMIADIKTNKIFKT